MNNPLSALRFSFLTQNQPFLKQGDLSIEFIGKPLKDLIFLDSDELQGIELQGIELDTYTVPSISKNIYNRVVSLKDKKISIKKNDVTLFIYTLCKVDEHVLFHVWCISTEIAHQERTCWEDSYGISEGLCCKKKYLKGLAEMSKDESFRKIVAKECFSNEQRFLSVSQSLGVDLTEENCKLKIEKNCMYNSTRVQCKPVVFSHLFNNGNSKAVDFNENCKFNISVNFDMTLSRNPEAALFSYGFITEPTQMLCNFLYDQIVFENTETFHEQNFLRFLRDSLLTCSNYQKNIITGVEDEKERTSSKTPESRLLYMSINL
jgi:hypothetical protein